MLHAAGEGRQPARFLLRSSLRDLDHLGRESPGLLHAPLLSSQRSVVLPQNFHAEWDPIGGDYFSHAS